MTVSATTRTQTWLLTAVGVACALASSIAFFLHVLGWVRMPFFINFVGLPAIILMITLGLYAWNRRLPFWRRFSAGVVAGAVGLLAYDLVRLAVYSSGLLDYYPFHAIPILGSLITGLPPSAPSSIFAGWLYHTWNGFSFALIYALLAGPARWWWGVAWAMLLETGMLLSYPSFLAIQASATFVIVSVVGHIAYGTVLGLTVRRLAREGGVQ
jgi:hypothetical protein